MLGILCSSHFKTINFLLFSKQLGVQITEVCLATKANNGGLISLDDLLKLVLKGRGRTRQDVSELVVV